MQQLCTSGFVDVQQGLQPRDVSKWEATQRRVELHCFSSQFSAMSATDLTSFGGHKPCHTQQSLAVQANNA